MTYSFRSGSYLKIGTRVLLSGIVILSSKGSSTGSATVRSLPFTAQEFGALSVEVNGTTSPGPPYGNVTAGASWINLDYFAGGTSPASTHALRQQLDRVLRRLVCDVVIDVAPMEANRMTGDRPECHLVCIPPEKAALVWPLARDLIFAAMKRGDLSSFGPVEDSVLRGDALLWLALTCEDGGGVGIDAAAVTELHRTEWRKVCVVVACGATSGRLTLRRRRTSSLDPACWNGIEEFARAEGCSATRIIGRKGWARVLASYQTKRIVLEKEL